MPDVTPTTDGDRLARLEHEVRELRLLIAKLLDDFGPLLDKYRTKAAAGAARWAARRNGSA